MAGICNDSKCGTGTQEEDVKGGGVCWPQRRAQQSLTFTETGSSTGRPGLRFYFRTRTVEWALSCGTPGLWCFIASQKPTEHLTEAHLTAVFLQSFQYLIIIFQRLHSSLGVKVLWLHKRYTSSPLFGLFAGGHPQL